MALEFDLNLIMPEDNTAVFSRGALEMTVKLIKASAPTLAGEVAAILTLEPLPTGHETSEDRNQHMFHVQLPPDKIHAIIQHILSIMENKQTELPLGMNVVAKALFKDWTELEKFAS